ncbi:MAG: aminotransferase class I/II-fold pyridoxal phosphate-dependent enzyme [Silicimonas sp.]|nr:aminotransferase class I/II-fold pyridoxal phosphate-dependent enzyme [Silicimonas sp.]
MRRAKWPASSSTPVATPLQPSVVYASRDPDALDAQYEGTHPGYTYAREAHPNAQVLAGLIDGLEGASGGIVVGSGMAAITVALLGVLKAGDHVIGADQLYGRSLRMMTEELPRMGIETSLVDATDASAVEAALRPETKLILIETLSNPTLRMSDLEGILALRNRGVMVAVDNTFTTPALVKPLEMGADITIHSVTKMLAGHSDATLGYVAAKEADLNARFADLAATLGVTASPFDCWLGERGLYSFDLRFARASETAARLADALSDSGKTTKVLYPTRNDHPDHNKATRLLAGKGGNMVSFEIAGGRAESNRLVQALDGIAFAPTLGDIRTTVSHPPSSSHRAMAESGRQALGITEGFFRVSVGCEDADDLISAFLKALDQA